MFQHQKEIPENKLGLNLILNLQNSRVAHGRRELTAFTMVLWCGGACVCTRMCVWWWAKQSGGVEAGGKYGVCGSRMYVCVWWLEGLGWGGVKTKQTHYLLFKHDQ